MLRNVPVCEYHRKLYHEWHTPQELAIMEQIRRDYLKGLR